MRSRSFSRKADAQTFDREIHRRLQLGPALAAELDRRTMTLAQFVEGPWRAHAATLAPGSRVKYAWALEKHLVDLLDEPLVSIDAPAIAVHQRLMMKRGASTTTIREVIGSRLSGILQVAAEHGYLPAGNPARSVRKLPAEHVDPVVPLSPVELEQLIASFDGRGRAIGLLAGHLGLRPIEVRRVPWDRLDGDTLHILKQDTKPSARPRSIEVPQMTLSELRAWRLESGGRGDTPIIGDTMTADALKKWCWRNLPDDVWLYRLRHTHASVLHYCGFPLPDAADRMGHSIKVHAETYAHVIRQARRQRWDSLDEAILAARNDPMFRQCSASNTAEA
jgi:integrase